MFYYICFVENEWMEYRINDSTPWICSKDEQIGVLFIGWDGMKRKIIL
jgi:hypothetical protein